MVNQNTARMMRASESDGPNSMARAQARPALARSYSIVSAVRPAAVWASGSNGSAATARAAPGERRLRLPAQ